MRVLLESADSTPCKNPNPQDLNAWGKAAANATNGTRRRNFIQICWLRTSGLLKKGSVRNLFTDFGVWGLVEGFRVL